MSISNNIAEGFERQSTKEFIYFLYNANGSAAEVRSMLCIIEQLRDFKDLKSQISDLKLKAEECTRPLVGWANHLGNSDIAGGRHLTDEIRNKKLRDQDQKAFWAEIERINDEERRKREAERKI